MQVLHNESLIKSGINQLSTDMYKTTGKGYYKLAKQNQVETNNPVVTQLNDEFHRLKNRDKDRLERVIRTSKNKQILMSNLKMMYSLKFDDTPMQNARQNAEHSRAAERSSSSRKKRERDKQQPCLLRHRL